MARLGFPEPGEWWLIRNDVATVSKYKERRDDDDSTYRWVVVEPPMLLCVWASPRTRQDSYEGYTHDAHPNKHEPDCEIDCPGTVTEPRELDQNAFRDAQYSCTEPEGTWPDLQDACGVPRPRRPEKRRRRKS